VVVVLRESLETGKVRLNPSTSRKGPGRYSGLEGAANLVVEIVSDSSVSKDTERLPPLYAQAGVPELWLVDARGEEIQFSILTLRRGRYEASEPDADGWTPSLQLDCSFRLTRIHQPWMGSSVYKLENR
jgi:Uma2 family endonuclease